MNKMQEKLALFARAQRAEGDVRRLEAWVADLQRQLAEVSADRERLAEALVQGEAFGEWVLTLDLSSAHDRKPSEKFREKYSMENSEDVELALMFARHGRER